MEWLYMAFYSFYQIANTPIDLFGYVITLWQVFMFALFGGLIIWFLKNIFE